MVTARIAGFSPGTSPPPVKIPITPFLPLVAMMSTFLPESGTIIKHESQRAVL